MLFRYLEDAATAYVLDTQFSSSMGDTSQPLLMGVYAGRRLIKGGDGLLDSATAVSNVLSRVRATALGAVRSPC